MSLRTRLAGTMAALLGISAYALPPSPLPSLDSPEVERAREMFGGQLAPIPASRTRFFQSDLEAAEHNADAGDLQMAAQLMRAARKDGTYIGVLSTRTSGLVQLQKKFRGEADIIAALELGHDSVRSVFDEMCPPAELALMHADGIELGVAVGELVPVKGRDYPVLVRLDPEFLLFRWNENRWYYRSVVGLIPITPGDGRWVLHTPGGRIAPWRNGIWRAVAKAYIRKEHAGNFKDAWEAKLANPARVAIAPQGASETQKQSWFQKVMAWGVNTVFGLTPGYDVKLLESNGRGYESFDGTKDRSDREMIIAVAGQVVTTDGGAGFQNSDIHKTIRADLIQGDGDGLAYTVNTQIIPAFVIVRWDESYLTRSASLAWDTKPAKDLNAEAQTLGTFATAVKEAGEALAPYGLKPDVKELAQRFGVPIAGDLDGDGTPDVATDDVAIELDDSDLREAA